MNILNLRTAAVSAFVASSAEHRAFWHALPTNNEYIYMYPNFLTVLLIYTGRDRKIVHILKSYYSNAVAASRIATVNLCS